MMCWRAGVLACCKVRGMGGACAWDLGSMRQRRRTSLATPSMYRASISICPTGCNPPHTQTQTQTQTRPHESPSGPGVAGPAGSTPIPPLGMSLRPAPWLSRESPQASTRGGTGRGLRLRLSEVPKGRDP